MSEEKIEKEATEEFGPFEVKLEGLEDGYRVTFRGNKDEVKTQRRVGASFINFLRQAEKAGWPLPFPLRFLLKFWGKYNAKSV
jgi:hypothetical protein